MELMTTFVDEISILREITVPQITHMCWLTKTTFASNGDETWRYLVEISCQSSYELSNLWEVDTEIEVQFRNSSGGKCEEKMDCCFKNNALIFTFDKLCTVSKDSEWNACFNTLTRHVNFKIKSIKGIEIKEDIDFSIPRDIGSEVVVLVGDIKYYVNRYALMAISPVFCEILAESDEIKIQGVDYNDVLDFLRILYREEQEIFSVNIAGLLKLAHEYDIQFLMSDCEDYLLSAGSFFSFILNEKKLDYAEMYNLSKLQVEILEETQRSLKNA